MKQPLTKVVMALCICALAAGSLQVNPAYAGRQEKVADAPVSAPNPAVTPAGAADALIQFRILEVYAAEETGADWPGSDEIAVFGSATSRYGTNTIPMRTISNDFDEGETKRFDPPLVLQEFMLEDYPSDVLVSLIMVEKDNGGSSGLVEDIVDFVHKTIVEKAISAAGSGGTVEAVLAEGLKIAIREVIPYLKDFLGSWWKDDFFNPAQVATIRVESGGAFNIPGEVWFNDQKEGGRYRVTYDWNLVPAPSAAELAAAGADSPWNSVPWSQVQRRTPALFWANTHVLGEPPPSNIISRFSGKCMEVGGVSADNGAAAIQWGCTDANQKNQVWRLAPEGQYYKIIAEHSGKCLDVRGVLNDNGTPVQQWDCIPQQPNQLWTVRPEADGYQIIAAHSGKCLDLDISWDGSQNGALLQQWECLGEQQRNQLWYLQTPVAPSSPYQLWLPLIQS